MANDALDSIKLCILGSAHVGKTSIRQRAFDDIFVSDYVCTIGPEYSEKVREFQLHSKVIKIALWDGPGSTNRTTDAKKNTLMRGCQGAFVVFDVRNRESFSQVREFVKDVRRRSEFVVIVLLGNKVDSVRGVGQRVVSEEEASSLASRLLCKAYFETSAATGQGIAEAMEFLEQWCVDEIDVVSIPDATAESLNASLNASATGPAPPPSPVIPAVASGPQFSAGRTSFRGEAQSTQISSEALAPPCTESQSPPPTPMSGSTGPAVGSPSSTPIGGEGVGRVSASSPRNPWTAPRFRVQGEQPTHRALLCRWYPSTSTTQRAAHLRSVIDRLGSPDSEGERLLLYPPTGASPELCYMTLDGLDSGELSVVFSPLIPGKFPVLLIPVVDIAEIRPPGAPLPAPLARLSSTLSPRCEARDLLFAVIANQGCAVLGALSTDQAVVVVSALKLLADAFVPTDEKALRAKARFVSMRESVPVPSFRLGELYHSLRQGISLQTLRRGGPVGAILWLFDPEEPPKSFSRGARLVLSSDLEKKRWEEGVSSQSDGMYSLPPVSLSEWMLFTLGLEPLVQAWYRGKHRDWKRDRNSDDNQTLSLALSDLSEVRVAGNSNSQRMDPTLCARALFLIGSECTLPILTESVSERDALAAQLQALLLYLRPSVVVF